MNVYALFPLIATVAYIPLLVITIVTRPWRRQQRLFIPFLIAAMMWSLSEYLARSNYFPLYSFFLFQLVLISLMWMTVQLHHFMSSFYGPRQGRWLIFAWASFGVVFVLVALGYIPENVTIIDGIFYPEYGIGILVMAVPLMVLGGRNIYVFWNRLKTMDNPIQYNQVVSLLISIFVLIVFLLAALLPWGREFPISHFGNILVAFILSYATIRHQLIDIRLVLRRVLSWGTLIIAGIGIYLLIFFLGYMWFGFELRPDILVTGLGGAAAAVLLIFLTQGSFQQKIAQVFYWKTYDYRQKLSDFADRIQDVFNLKELGGDLLPLVIRAINCRGAGLLFPEGGSGDFIPQFIESQGEDNPLRTLRLRQDNPVVQYLSQQRRMLTIQNLGILPEFRSLWAQEKEAITTASIELFIPIISRDKLVSILVLSGKQSGRYLLEDVSLLEEVTSRVAVSLERGYLYEESRRREEELALISHLAAIVTSSLDIRKIYNDFIRELKKVLDVDWAALTLVEGKEINLLAIVSEIGSAWQTGDKLPLKGTATEWVVNNKVPLVEPNLLEESRFWTGKHHLKQGIQSLVFLPLMVGTEAIGAMCIASRRPNAYSISQVQLLSQLALRIAAPIENARLYAVTHAAEDLDIKYTYIKRTAKRWVRVCLVQLNFTPTLVAAPGEFGYVLCEDDKKVTEQKVFSALKIAQSERANIVCFPELSFSPEWVERIETEFRDMVIVGGSYYRARFNTCPVIIDGNTYFIRKINPSPDTEAEIGTGRGMNKGEEIVIFQTRFGRFVVLICYDYRNEAHRVLHNRSEKLRNVDFIINPCYNKDVANFQEQANQDCQQANYPYILQVNTAVIRGKKCGGTGIIGMEHESGINRYIDEGYRPDGESVKYMLMHAEGEMMLMADLDIKRKGVPVPAAGPKMKDICRYIYLNGDWRRYS